MDRLTQRKDGAVIFPSELVGVTVTPDNGTLFRILTKLAAYEDAEESGGLVRLPVNVGDTIYSVYNAEIHETKIKTVELSEYGIEFRDGFMGDWCFHADQIGENIFLTRDEAEAAMKRMGGG